MSQQTIIDASATPIGRQNWAVCERMLFHDLLDMAPRIPELKALLEFYGCGHTPDGGYTLALPRLKLLEARLLRVTRAKLSPLPKKK